MARLFYAHTTVTMATINGIDAGAPATGPIGNGVHTLDVPNFTTDVLIIGGGFGGVYGMHKFRQLNLSVKLIEAGADFGGTWHWNR